MTSEISSKELFRLLPWSLGKLSLWVLPSGTPLQSSYHARRRQSHMERPCVDAPVTAPAVPRLWVIPTQAPDGSKETSDDSSPCNPSLSQPLEPSQLSSQTLWSRDKQTALPLIQILEPWNLCKIKWLLFDVTKSGVVCYSTTDNQNTFQLDCGSQKVGKSLVLIVSLIYSMVPGGMKDALTKCLLSAVERLKMCYLFSFF